MIPVSTDADRYRRAVYQLKIASDSLAAARTAAESLKSKSGAPLSVRDGMADALDLIDDAGSSIGDYLEIPDKIDAGKVKKAIDACNDALQDADDIGGIVSDLSQSAPGAFQNPLEAVEGPIDQTSDALREALAALGGKPAPADAETPSSGDDSGAGA